MVASPVYRKIKAFLELKELLNRQFGSTPAACAEPDW